MNRLVQTFAELRGQDKKALMPFVTAGYPSLEATAAILRALDRTGVRVCELGIPFSDPIADGPVIQASMTESLKKDLHVQDTFGMVAALRAELKMALVAMVSYSIVYRIGAEKFIHKAKASGFDGLIFPDLPLEEEAAVSQAVQEAGMVQALLIAPTTPPDRAAKIARACSGFVYMLARTGITGERASLPEGLEQRVSDLRKATDLPIAVGFGIATAEHVHAVTRVADAAIVGSAMVRRITQYKDRPVQEIAEQVGRFAVELSAGLG